MIGFGGAGSLAGRVAIETVESRALAANRLGEPHIRKLPVYLPPGYDGANVAYMDRVIAAGAPPAILVVVDGFTEFGGSQYLNSGATGRCEDFVVAEVVAHIDRTYRTMASPSHSGDMHFEACYKPDFWKFATTVARYGGVEGFLRAFLEMPKKTTEVVTAVGIAAMAMAYSPNPDRPPFYFALPFDPNAGELDEATWARWLAWESLHLAPRHEHVEFDDDHTGINYRYVESLRRLCTVLAGGHGG